MPARILYALIFDDGALCVGIPSPHLVSSNVPHERENASLLAVTGGDLNVHQVLQLSFLKRHHFVGEKGKEIRETV